MTLATNLRRLATAGLLLAGGIMPAYAEGAADEIRLLKARLKVLEQHVATQEKKQKYSGRDHHVNDVPHKVTENHWYDHLSIRGYVQGRYSGIINSNVPRSLVRVPGDRSVGNNQGFLLRRVRMILSGDVTDHLSLYLQPDFASTPSGADSRTGTTYFAQLRDAYADIYFDHDKEYRIRAGQSKIPYSFENMQSSQNRIVPDRNDGTNACCRDERDIGLFFYWTPKHLRPVFRDLVRNNLKGSGDYGMFALGVYNGQGANRFELNNEMHIVSRFTYPYTFENGQIFEAGVQAIMGRFVVPGTSATVGTTAPSLRADGLGFRDQRVGVHAVLYPQPIGIQAEWNWGVSPALNETLTSITTRSLSGGYIQATYKYDDKIYGTGTYFPFVRYSHYRGGQKFETNAPYNKMDDWEFGVEYQPVPELEFTALYGKLNRSNLFTVPYQRFQADVVRTQLQWNF